jgi:hypothetical protein
VALIGASGVVAGSDKGNIAIEANLDLFEAEVLVGQALAMSAQSCRPGEDEPERPNTIEIVGEERRQLLGVSGAPSGGPVREERIGVGCHPVSFRRARLHKA